MNLSDIAKEPTAPAARARKLDASERRSLFGLALPPLAWTLHLLLAYALVYPSIRLHSKALLVVVTAVCAASSLVGALLAPASARMHSSERARFMARIGRLSSAFFTLTIVAQSIPIAVFGFEDP